MTSLPQGDFICESTSPKGTFTINLYETNPALSAGGQRGELIINETRKRCNIYWEYNRNIKGYEIIWEDDDTVIINGTRLNLPIDTYDWRRDR